MKRVLVTGAQGFIGKHVMRRLTQDGHFVCGVDNLIAGQDPKECAFVGLQKALAPWSLQKDFTDPWVLGQLRMFMFDTVVHLAAIPRVSYSVEKPYETFYNNVSKTAMLLDACRGSVKKFIFASSSSVYGGASVLPTPETRPLDPKSPYAMQKQMGEQMMRQYAMHYDMDCIALRFFNVFGPGALGDSPYSTAVAAWLTAYHTGRSCRFDGDGSQSRDLCYIDNTVDCVSLAVAAGTQSGVFRPYNVACGQSTTNREVYEFLQARYPDIKKVHAPPRAGDVMHTRADIFCAGSDLGYKPSVYVMDGLERTCQWFEEKFKKQ